MIGSNVSDYSDSPTTDQLFFFKYFIGIFTIYS
jgi:hypothetical protein